MNECSNSNQRCQLLFNYLNKYMLGHLHKHMIEAAMIKYIILPCMKQGN